MGRSGMLNLDTHIFLRALDDSLSPGEEALLATDRWGISGIVLWEITKLHQLGRIPLGLEHPALAELLRQVHVWPVDRQVAYALVRLDIRADPADELIAATSIAHNVPLVTRDARLLASSVVPFPLSP